QGHARERARQGWPGPLRGRGPGAVSVDAERLGEVPHAHPDHEGIYGRPGRSVGMAHEEDVRARLEGDEITRRVEAGVRRLVEEDVVVAPVLLRGEHRLLRQRE